MRVFLTHITISAAVALIVSFSYLGGLFFGSEHFLEDLLVSKKSIDERIVILAIDDESIKKIGQWPWPREVFGRGFQKLESYKPKAVGLDVVFSEVSRYGETDDQKLSSQLGAISYPLVMPIEGSLTLGNGAVSLSGVTKPRSIFTNHKMVLTGHVNLLLDPDGVVRRLPVIVEEKGKEIKAFSAVLGEKGGAFIEEANILPIVYAGEPGSVRRIPFHRVLDENLESLLEGKIILIGATSPDLHDEKPTPLSQGTQMAGVEIQAQALNMFLKGFRLNPLSDPFSVALIFLITLITAIIFSIEKRALRAALWGVILGVLINVFIFILYDLGTVLNIIHLNIAWILSAGALFGYRYFIEERDKRYLRGVFSKYVSPLVLEKILSDPKGVSLGGEEKTITLLFSDIRGFTTLSEKTTPTELVRILNRYFTLMTGEVLKHSGVLDKYIGDAVMAFWGAPINDPEQAENAFKAALGMLDRLKEFNKELKKEKGITIDIGIGLYTGTAVVGNMGSIDRFDYTAMGDTVNVASRLEGLNKEYKTNLIVGETTKERLKNKEKLRPLGETAVKGREKPLQIFTIK